MNNLSRKDKFEKKKELVRKLMNKGWTQEDIERELGLAKNIFKR